MHTSVVNDCLAAGANTQMCPDIRRYFDVKIDDVFLHESDDNNDSLKMILKQRDKFRNAIVSNMETLR